MSIVGLGDRAVEEAKDRISAAVKNSGYVSPKQKNQKVVISLAPPMCARRARSFDLPMALSYLSAAGDIEFARLARSSSANCPSRVMCAGKWPDEFLTWLKPPRAASIGDLCRPTRRGVAARIL